MTFDEASKLIKKGDIIRLRKELQDGLSPNMANQYSSTLLMIAALEGNTSIGGLRRLLAVLAPPQPQRAFATLILSRSPLP